MQSKGAYRVGVDFNPSNKDEVTLIKQAAARLIDMVDMIPDLNSDLSLNKEVVRLKALAQTAAEEAAMWAVKAATKPERN